MENNDIEKGNYYIQEEKHSDVWMMTLADLLSLLLVFFILIYATSTIRQGKWSEITDSLESTFSFDSAVTSNIESTSLGVNRKADIDAINLSYLDSILDNKISRDEFLSRLLSVKLLDDRLVISINSKSLFEGNTPVLSDELNNILVSIGDILRKVGNKVDVVSYIDGESRGLPTAWELAMTRAAVVADELRQYGNESKMNAFVKVAEKVDISKKTETEDNGGWSAVDIIVRNYAE